MVERVPYNVKSLLVFTNIEHVQERRVAVKRKKGKGFLPNSGSYFPSRGETRGLVNVFRLILYR